MSSDDTGQAILELRNPDELTFDLRHRWHILIPPNFFLSCVDIIFLLCEFLDLLIRRLWLSAECGAIGPAFDLM